MVKNTKMNTNLPINSDSNKNTIKFTFFNPVNVYYFPK